MWNTFIIIIIIIGETNILRFIIKTILIVFTKTLKKKKKFHWQKHRRLQRHRMKGSSSLKDVKSY